MQEQQHQTSPEGYMLLIILGIYCLYQLIHC